MAQNSFIKISILSAFVFCLAAFAPAGTGPIATSPAAAQQQNDSPDNTSASDAGDKEKGPGREAGFKGFVEKNIRPVHMLWLVAAFLVLGIFMAVSGIIRFNDRIKKAKVKNAKLKRKIHISRGKIYVGMVLIGFAGGFAIFVMDQFKAEEAVFHLIGGGATAACFAAGGAIGLFLAKGKALSLRPLHMALNLAGTALFIFNIVTGILLVVSR
jgi:hypothetical protein